MINLTKEQSKYSEWERAMSNVIDMSTWEQADKLELYFENMEQLMFGEDYSYSAPCN